MHIVLLHAQMDNAVGRHMVVRHEVSVKAYPIFASFLIKKCIQDHK